MSYQGMALGVGESPSDYYARWHRDDFHYDRHREIARREQEAKALPLDGAHDIRSDCDLPRFEAVTPSRALSTDSAARKATPLATGLLDYFPDALAEVARLSKAANDKHNPGEPMHWSRHKSADHADCIVRHLIDRGQVDEDGFLHDVKVAWRALALLQVALEGRS